MHDPLREASRWLSQAEVDLEAARHLSPRFPGLACFHAQQAAEKALKAILYAAGQRPVLGHSTGQLGSSVERESPGYAALRREVAALDRFYIPTRYPNGLPEGGDPSEVFTETDADAAIAVAAKAVRYAQGDIAGRAADATGPPAGA